MTENAGIIPFKTMIVVSSQVATLALETSVAIYCFADNDGKSKGLQNKATTKMRHCGCWVRQ